jgi:DNA-binding transcriptional ArsR family regulator
MSRTEAAPPNALLFAALGDATRLGFVTRLADGSERSITQLGEGLTISRQAVAKHLDVLHGAGLVRRRRRGREVHFALHRDAITQARGWLDEVSAQWDESLGRLKAFVETD